MTTDTNPRIHIGANGGPPLDPFAMSKQEVDDLFEEAKVWLDGTEITSEAEAEAVETLLTLSRKAKATADGSRKVENEPFDTGKAEVQARYNPVLKRADLIADTCKQRLTPWRTKVAAEKEALAEQLRRDAEAELAAATAAIRETSGDIEAREAAEEQLRFAQSANKVATRAEKKATTGQGLRTTYRAELVDAAAALDHYWAKSQTAFEDMVIGLAANDVRNGVRSIPGFVVHEERVAV